MSAVDSRGAWVRGFCEGALRLMSRDRASLAKACREAKVTLADARRAGVSREHLAELRRAGVEAGSP